MSAERTPVIVGQGEVLDRPARLEDAREPLVLAAAAAAKADEDAGGGFVASADALDLVHFHSWRYADPARELAARLKIAPKRAEYSQVGGETPVKLIHDAALRIARGESRVALVVGAEAGNSNTKARAQGVELPWTPFVKSGPKGQRGTEMVHPLAAELGVAQPTFIYPFYDVASAAAWEQTPAEALAESGEIWAKYSEVAAGNPTSWLKRRFTAEEITTPTADNRLIAYPYTKLMVANPQVNQAAALVVTSLALARERGVPESRIVYILGGAAAEEPHDFLARDQFEKSHAQDAVLEAALQLSPQGFDALELYSCFPCVPKMARRSLGLPRDFTPSVTGGHTFFGGPLNDYMLHAACAMTRRMRDGSGTGLLYGQGEFVTMHHALVVSSRPAEAPMAQDYSVQAESDSRRWPVPEIVVPRPGFAYIETATVLYQRDGSVQHGVVILGLANGQRTICAVAADDAASLAALTDPDTTPVGRDGVIVQGASGRMEFVVRSDG